jgi:NAD(P)-dependent dehydrogenase (short-subunit alcohol dehydrogenase family)
MAGAFEGREVVVTGGTGALGAAVVGALLERGATCHVPYLAAMEAERFAHRGHERVRLSGPVDLTDEAAVGGFYGGVTRLWGSIHLAGGFAMAPIEHTDSRAFAAQIEMNLTSCFLCCRAAVAAVSASGVGGRIVNVAARPGLEPRLGAGMIAYATSKAGVAALTQALAQEVVDRDILVNAVAPSTLDTPGNRAAMPKADFSKWAKLDDVAAAILFLASPENRVTRGAIVTVYGKS